MTPAARHARIARLRRRVARHERRRDELVREARVEGLFVLLLAERLAWLEAQQDACERGGPGAVAGGR
jgi:hypothetical protein